MTGEKHEQGAELIRKAFATARSSGVAEWQTMTIAVLKNRMLDLTDREFDEADWGAGSFKDFVGMFDDLLVVVPSSHPMKVTIRDGALPREASEGSPTQPGDPGPNRRVRGDLWKALLDYSSESPYVWDGEAAVRVDAESLEPGAKVLPTLTKDELKEWRQKFVEAQSIENPRNASLLYDWLRREDPLAVLPTSLRIPWVVTLKRQVAERLEAWFAAEGVDAPEILVTVDEKPALAGEASAEELRERVVEVVRTMSQAELESLQLPVSALFRRRD